MEQVALRPLEQIKSEEDGDSDDSRSLRVDSRERSHSRQNGNRRPLPSRKRTFSHLPDSTEEATEAFTIIETSIYSNKGLGASEHDGMGCDCNEEWDNDASVNLACGEDANCINRATKMECMDDECNCGIGCQNQRFQRQEYASVSVIKTEKKGYGLRAETGLSSHQFIFEYVGEVITEQKFRQRMTQYDEQGIKHFYFMSLTKDAFVDATKKGNLARFCNHSCSPNCYVDKWIVGNKLRMGIFAERDIVAGEELVFNYNVDRYGANPQPCYCDEPNCTGFIGGKTQTERATKLSAQTIEALGIDDHDGWDFTSAKRARRKKQAEDDEEYVNKAESRPLDQTGVTSVMSTLMQCKEKWIAVKLLDRIEKVVEEGLLLQVIKFHGYPIMRTTLLNWKDDTNVILQVLHVLQKFPRITRNKIVDSKIDETMDELSKAEDERVREQAQSLLQIWSTLELAYRIPRRSPEERRKAREKLLQEMQEKKQKAEPKVEAPKGPKAAFRSSAYLGGRPRRFPPKALPKGWFEASDGGRTYYYTAAGETTWQFPTKRAASPPPKAASVSNEQRLQDIIDNITKSSTPKEKPAEPEVKERKDRDKWRSYSLDKQKKMYENTLAGPVKYVMGKFKDRLPHEELKRYGKEIAKLMVASDYKNNRVTDPTRISSNKEREVKKNVKTYLDKAVAKRERKRMARETDKLKDSAKATPGSGHASELASEAEAELQPGPEPPGVASNYGQHSLDDDMDLNIVSDTESTPALSTPLADSTELKRKRDREADPPGAETPGKKIRSQSPPPPPPPPPPPASDTYDMEDIEVEDGSTPLTPGAGNGFSPSVEDLAAKTEDTALEEKRVLVMGEE